MSESSELETYEKQRVALVIQYLGTHFHGWQRQPNGRTVQEELEKALTEIVGSRVAVHGAGRTDAGVHAAAQVAHFDYRGAIPADKWAKILNSCLPDDISIRASAAVPATWHARFSALWRRYRYTIYTSKRPNLFVQSVCWHYYQTPLKDKSIEEALQPLLGKHHLAAFHRAGSARKHSWVNVQAVECQREGDFLHLEIQADGFLYGMVRLLVGMLVEVGIGKRSPADFTNLWLAENREEVKYAAPAKGLCLLRVGYPDFPFAPELWFDNQPKFVFSRSF